MAYIFVNHLIGFSSTAPVNLSVTISIILVWMHSVFEWLLLCLFYEGIFGHYGN